MKSSSEFQSLFMFQKSGSKDGGGKTPGCLETGQEIGSNPMSPTPTTPTPNTPGTPKSPLPCTATTPTKTGVPDTMKTSPGSAWHKIAPSEKQMRVGISASV